MAGAAPARVPEVCGAAAARLWFMLLYPLGFAQVVVHAALSSGFCPGCGSCCSVLWVLPRLWFMLLCPLSFAQVVVHAALSSGFCPGLQQCVTAMPDQLAAFEHC
jgi:hypothetical protein